jgi:hypothetical protein
MTDHFDSDDPRTDLTDLYVFPAPGRDDRSVLILDFNPDASALDKEAVFARLGDPGRAADRHRRIGDHGRGTCSIGRRRKLDFLRSVGYSETKAGDLVPDFLPDVLTYDPPSRAAIQMGGG